MPSFLCFQFSKGESVVSPYRRKKTIRRGGEYQPEKETGAQGQEAQVQERRQGGHRIHGARTLTMDKDDNLPLVGWLIDESKGL